MTSSPMPAPVTPRPGVSKAVRAAADAAIERIRNRAHGPA